MQNISRKAKETDKDKIAKSKGKGKKIPWYVQRRMNKRAGRK